MLGAQSCGRAGAAVVVNRLVRHFCGPFEGFPEPGMNAATEDHRRQGAVHAQGDVAGCSPSSGRSASCAGGRRQTGGDGDGAGSAGSTVADYAADRCQRASPPRAAERRSRFVGLIREKAVRPRAVNPLWSSLAGCWLSSISEVASWVLPLDVMLAGVGGILAV